MSEVNIRADIKKAVLGVSKVGVVHDYERYASEWSVYLDLFKTTIDSEKIIRGWTITCESFPQGASLDSNIGQLTLGKSATESGKIIRNYTYKIRGYFGLDDMAGSEKTAIGIAEDVVELFDYNINTGTDNWWNYPADLTLFEIRQFGSVLCHYAEVTAIMEEIRNP